MFQAGEKDLHPADEEIHDFVKARSKSAPECQNLSKGCSSSDTSNQRRIFYFSLTLL